MTITEEKNLYLGHFEQLEKELGPDKAHALRDATYGGHHIMSGCPNQK